MTSLPPCSPAGESRKTPCTQDTFRIRPAAPEDAARIAELVDEADMGELSDRGVTWVAERDRHVLGFLHPPARRRGPVVRQPRRRR